MIDFYDEVYGYVPEGSNKIKENVKLCNQDYKENLHEILLNEIDEINDIEKIDDEEKTYISNLLKDVIKQNLSIGEMLKIILKDQRFACVGGYEDLWHKYHGPVYSGNESELFDYEEAIKNAMPERIF